MKTNANIKVIPAEAAIIGSPSWMLLIAVYEKPTTIAGSTTLNVAGSAGLQIELATSLYLFVLLGRVL